MRDLISRKAAIGALCDDCPRVQSACPHYPCREYLKIEELPSVQQWIPISERLPKEKEDVLLAFKQNMIVGFWENVLGDDVTWYANSGDGWMTGTETVDNDGIPLAWMPLPEPWKEES